MKRTIYAIIILAVAAAIGAAGCSTVPKKMKEEMSGIKTKVDTLESRVETVETKQVEVEKTAAEHGQAIEEIKTEKQGIVKTNISVKPKEGVSNFRIKDAQAALKNAGYYDGKIDGVKGPQTKKAIRAFQEANGLRADGVIGPKTWDLLSRHVNAAAAGTAGAGGKSESAE